MTSTTGRRSTRRARIDCRNGDHRFGRAQSVGGGILRRLCSFCGSVSIDLTAADRPIGGGPLFKVAPANLVQ